jgi:sugar phosphate isomerase/epimerase
MHNNRLSRRHLLAGAAALPLAGLAAASTLALDSTATLGAKPDPWRGLKISVATYTFKQRKLEPTIEGIQRVGISYCSIKDFHLPLKSTADQRKEVADKFRAAGIQPLSCGVITLPNKEETVKQAFEYARDAGIPTIVGSPDAAALPLVEKYVKEFNIRLAIHNHGPEDKKWPNPTSIWPAIEKLDERIGFCIDVGHCARAKEDPAEAMRKYKARLYDVHFKDLEGTEPKSKVTEVGRGVLNIRGMLQALLDIGYPHLVSFEYEKDIDKVDPLPGLAESVGYVRGTLSDMTPNPAEKHA